MLGASFNLQGHRGARGLRPENTLPSFETALDAGVSSIETDLHLSCDGQVVVSHDPTIGPRLCRLVPGYTGAEPVSRPLLSQLTVAQLRCYQADGNPDPARFPTQDNTSTPVATAFSQQRGVNVYGLPTLDELFEFVAAYAGPLGQHADKSPDPLAKAARTVFDLELKHVPGRPELIGDGFDGQSAGLLEERVLEAIHRHAVLDRTIIRSFDHRSVKAIKQREPRLRTAVLVAGTAPVAPEELAARAGASIYCPEYHFVDHAQVLRLHAAGIAVLPWTVNDPADWQRLLAWGVDGITTDFPDRLAAVLRENAIPF